MLDPWSWSESTINKLHSPKFTLMPQFHFQFPKSPLLTIIPDQLTPSCHSTSTPNPYQYSVYYRAATHLNSAWIPWQSGQWHSGTRRDLGIHHLYKRPKEFCYLPREAKSGRQSYEIGIRPVNDQRVNRPWKGWQEQVIQPLQQERRLFQVQRCFHLKCLLATHGFYNDISMVMETA